MHNLLGLGWMCFLGMICALVGYMRPVPPAGSVESLQVQRIAGWVC